MVTVKEEVLDGSATLEHMSDEPVHCYDHDSFEHMSGDERLAALSAQLPSMSTKTHWSHPGPVGPQESYESAFQATPPAWPPMWPPAINPQPKPENRTIPTTLDRYAMALQAHEQQTMMRAGNADQGNMHMPDEQNIARPLIPTYDRIDQELPHLAREYDWATRPGGDESCLSTYQTCLKYLEEQNEARKQSGLPELSKPAIASAVTASGRAARKADYQMQLMLLEQQNKKRLMLARQELGMAEMSPPSPTIPRSDAIKADYQMQLMLLEQQNKRRLMMARQEQDALRLGNRQSSPGTESRFRAQSVASDSTWSTQFTPESTPDLDRWEPSAGGVNHIQLNLMGTHPHASGPASHLHSLNPSQPPLQSSCNCANGVQLLGDHDIQPACNLEQQTQNQFLRKQTATPTPPTWSLQHYQEELMLKENRNRDAILRRENFATSSGEANRARQNDHAQEAVQDEGQLRETAGDDSENQGGDEQVWITHGTRDSHKKPLVIRGRPTCDD